MHRLILSGGTVVLPDALMEPASVVVENDTIVAVEHRAYSTARSASEQVVADDNDFDISTFDGAGNTQGPGAKSRMLFITLTNPLPMP